MGLLERDREIEVLGAALRAVTDRGGQAFAVTGESGAGKSALVRATCGDASGLRVLHGACDPLSTPRPLGPIRDIIGDLDGPSPDVTGRPAALATFCEEVFAAIGSQPTVVAVEDAQWIDEASVDVLRFVVRRIEAAPVVLLLTYRDDEIDAGHQLRPLLGDLARIESATTLPLAPLSLAAVTTLLAGTSLDPTAVLELTAGNAFYVTEVAGQPGDGLPASVRDAVLASTSGIGADDLDVLQLIATAPDGLDDRLLPPLGIDLATMRRLEATGLLLRTRRGVTFRHELARLAIADSLSPSVGVEAHIRIVDALEAIGSTAFATLTHHAVAAGDGRASRWARVAADEAIRTGSYTEAVAFLQSAIEHCPDEARTDRAELLQLLSFEQYMTDRLPDAITTIEAALELWRALGDLDGQSAAHDQCALFEYYSANRRAAEDHSRHAADAAMAVGSELRLGFARSTSAFLALRRHDFPLAAACDVDAHDIAQHLRDEMLRLRSEIVDGAAVVAGGDETARAALLERVDEAMAVSLDEIASMGMSNLSHSDVEQRRFGSAGEVLSRSLPFTVERDIPVCQSVQTGVRARLHFCTGDWEAALDDAHAVLDSGGAPVARVWPHLVVGLVALRRGEPSDDLDEAWELHERLAEPLPRLAVLSALAERTWLEDTTETRLDAAGHTIGELAAVPGLEWARGDLAVWLQRLGADVPRDITLAEPFQLSLDGNPAGAAARWRRIGAPFEEAMCSAESDDPALRVAGIERLDGLGAVASADRCRRDLRQRGVSNLPARPRASTRANPAGLTNRQLEVAQLVAEGLTNAELADRLYIRRPPCLGCPRQAGLRQPARGRPPGSRAGPRLNPLQR